MGIEVPEQFLGETTESKETNGALTSEQMRSARNHWIKKVQSNTSPNLQVPGWELVKDEANIFSCSERVSGYRHIYIEGGLFSEKLLSRTHE